MSPDRKPSLERRAEAEFKTILDSVERMFWSKEVLITPNFPQTSYTIEQASKDVVRRILQQ